LDSKGFPTSSSIHSTMLPERSIDITESLLASALAKMDFGKSETILDFGCGTGHMTVKHLAPLAVATGSKVFAVDLAPEMIQYAKTYQSHPSVYYVCGDVTSTRFPLTGIRFNKIICNFVLEYVQDYGKLLVDLTKLLKPNGVLWVMTTADKEMFDCLKKIKTNTKFLPYLNDVAVPDWVTENGVAENYYKKVLQKENLNVSEITTHTTSLTIDQLRDAVELLICANSGSEEERMPPSLLDEFKQVITKEVKNCVGGNNQSADYKLLTFYIRN